MSNKICCIFNLAPHYRAPIYQMMDKKLGCDFYFGNTLNNQIKLIEYSTLIGFKKEVKNKPLKKFGFMWQKGVWRLVFKPYDHYIITGSPSILSNWVLLLLAKLTGKKVYAWTHGLTKPVENKGELFQKIFYRLCHKILLYGDNARNIMLNEGFANDKLVAIYNSLDYTNQLNIRNTLSINPIFSEYFKNKNPTIIYIGRIQKVKKLDLLIEAVYHLKLNLNVSCNLVFLGEDKEGNNLPGLVQKYSLEKTVWFYGPCYDERIIANMLYNSAVCVSPGPVGLTALHALTYGCPVISNNDFPNQMPEHEAIEVNETGEFFKNEDVSSLASSIKKWVELNHNERVTIRKKAYQMIDSKWNPNAQIKTLKKTLNLSL